MAERRKVLFLSAPVGSGHVRAARAVGAALRSLAPEVGVDFADVFDFFSPRLGQGLLKTYLALLDTFPGVYGRMYQWGNSSNSAVAGRELISRYLARRMDDYIRAISPDAIVCTHATPAGLAAHLAKTGRLSIPILAVVTDFVVHRLWLYPEISRYFVAHDGLCDFLAEHGAGAVQAYPFGIPVDEKFTYRQDRGAVLKSLGLDPGLKTLLIMGGGAGVLPMPDIITACDKIGAHLQIIAVTGNNAALRRKLQDLSSRLRGSSLLSLGFVDNIHELMTAADLLVSKPGGMTVAEALCRELPLVIFRPIPGQEEANTRYLVERSIAESSACVADLQSKVKDLLFTRPQHLSELRQNAAAAGRPSASRDIAQVILSVLNLTKNEGKT
ncbi:MAG: glycosyltransferase [Negativicutes bacterium]|nr:glycosyltransferase [Negativicutes bacterium]